MRVEILTIKSENYYMNDFKKKFGQNVKYYRKNRLNKRGGKN